MENNIFTRITIENEQGEVSVMSKEIGAESTWQELMYLFVNCLHGQGYVIGQTNMEETLEDIVQQGFGM